MLRVSYARTLESPFNENLVVASEGCNIAVIADLIPCVQQPNTPGFRNDFHAGLQQAFGRYAVVSGDYIWKYTHTRLRFQHAGCDSHLLSHRMAQFQDSGIRHSRERAGFPRIYGAGSDVERGRALLPAPNQRFGGHGRAEWNSPSALTTTKNSTKRRTCNISLGKPDHGSASTGDTTAVWWPARHHATVAICAQATTLGGQPAHQHDRCVCNSPDR